MDRHQIISHNKSLIELKELWKDLKVLKALHSKEGNTISTDSLHYQICFTFSLTPFILTHKNQCNHLKNKRNHIKSTLHYTRHIQFTTHYFDFESKKIVR